MLKNDYLNKLENRSIYIIREAYARFKKIALLWSIGKDSTCLIWIAQKAFFGKILFPVIHIDTGFKFKEIYRFRGKYAKIWNINLLIAKNKEALKKGMSHDKGAILCCSQLKTEPLKKTLTEYGFRALLLGIRRDEHGIRAKERYFSPRDASFHWDYMNQPAEIWNLYKASVKSDSHIRIHPLLHWREIDVWQYIKKEKIPLTTLYFAKNKKRYRSIGCKCCCKPIFSCADSIDKILKELKLSKDPERAGRVQDKEDPYAMQKLRSLGYM